MSTIDPLSRVSEKAIVHEDVEIGPFCVIEDDVEIGSGTRVGPHSRIQGPCVIGRDCDITGYSNIGTPPQDLSYRGEDTRLEIGDRNTIREYVTINRGTLKDKGLTAIGNDNLIMAYCHIGHDCILGDRIVMGNLATLAGHTKIEDHVIVGGLSAIHQFTRIGAYAIVGGGSMVSLDIIPYAKASGNRAKLFGINTIGLKRNNFSSETIKDIGHAYRILLKQGLLLKDALSRLEKEYPECNEIKELVTFIRSSSRGIAR